MNLRHFPFPFASKVWELWAWFLAVCLKGRIEQNLVINDFGLDPVADWVIPRVNFGSWKVPPCCRGPCNFPQLRRGILFDLNPCGQVTTQPSSPVRSLLRRRETRTAELRHHVPPLVHAEKDRHKCHVQTNPSLNFKRICPRTFLGTVCTCSCVIVEIRGELKRCCGTRRNSGCREISVPRGEYSVRLQRRRNLFADAIYNTVSLFKWQRTALIACTWNKEFHFFAKRMTICDFGLHAVCLILLNAASRIPFLCFHQEMGRYIQLSKLHRFISEAHTYTLLFMILPRGRSQEKFMFHLVRNLWKNCCLYAFYPSYDAFHFKARMLFLPVS